jgi:hypothetical protein
MLIRMHKPQRLRTGYDAKDRADEDDDPVQVASA